MDIKIEQKLTSTLPKNSKKSIILSFSLLFAIKVKPNHVFFHIERKYKKKIQIRLLKKKKKNEKKKRKKTN